MKKSIYECIRRRGATKYRGSNVSAAILPTKCVPVDAGNEKCRLPRGGVTGRAPACARRDRKWRSLGTAVPR
jgi:hypothetical protein